MALSIFQPCPNPHGRPRQRGQRAESSAVVLCDTLSEGSTQLSTSSSPGELSQRCRRYFVKIHQTRPTNGFWYGNASIDVPTAGVCVSPSVSPIPTRKERTTAAAFGRSRNVVGRPCRHGHSERIAACFCCFSGQGVQPVSWVFGRRRGARAAFEVVEKGWRRLQVGAETTDGGEGWGWRCNSRGADHGPLRGSMTRMMEEQMAADSTKLLL